MPRGEVYCPPCIALLPIMQQRQIEKQRKQSMPSMPGQRGITLRAAQGESKTNGLASIAARVRSHLSTTTHVLAGVGSTSLQA